MTDREALLAEILAHPESDLPRLVYADFIEEHEGEIERAEFIRLSASLHHLRKSKPCPAYKSGVVCRSMSCEICNLHRREGQLIELNGREWFGDTAIGFSHEDNTRRPDYIPTVMISRGFVAGVRAPMDWLVGGECPNYENHTLGYRCPHCFNNTGRTPGHLAEIVRTQPVEFVGVSDKRPRANDLGPATWYNGDHHWELDTKTTRYLDRYFS